MEKNSISVNKVELKIDWATHKAAKYACENWHYAKCLPIGKLVKIGVWENNKFVGVVIYGRGTSPKLGCKYNLEQNECVELVRVALTKHKSCVSRIISIAQKYLKQFNPNLRLVVSFASQNEGHYGGIYQAGNWIYNGVTSPKDEFMFNGKRATDRVLSEYVKNTRIGRRELERRGLIFRFPTTTKFRYLMPLDDEIRQRILPLSKPYPKRPKQGNDADHANSDGATPIRTLQEKAA